MRKKLVWSALGVVAIAAGALGFREYQAEQRREHRFRIPSPQGTTVLESAAHDVSQPLSSLGLVAETVEKEPKMRLPFGVLAPESEEDEEAREEREAEENATKKITMVVPAGSAQIEQIAPGTVDSIRVVQAFDGLGVGFTGPQGAQPLRNPSDNTLAVGPNHIVQIVNTRAAIFTKKGKLFDTTGKTLYGSVPTNNFFKGFGGSCESKANGDAVVRYDQLADRWLIVMPLFSRSPRRTVEPPTPRSTDGPVVSMKGREQPGSAEKLYQPPPAPDAVPAPPTGGARPVITPPRDSGSYGMCYAVSVSNDPMGAYYRYEFVRPLFPDYPRPAVWPDGYYVPSSTGDEVIQKHACVADRARMLKGEDATEQCVIVDDVNFLNNADVDGTDLPPKGAPNIMLAAGGSQLKKRMEDDGIYAWSFHVDWSNPAYTAVIGPKKIVVAPYHYLCDGQLTSCVPQPGTDRRLDAQGDKLMSRVVYRRIGKRESIVAVHSVNSAVGRGGVRWYEFTLDKNREISLAQQGTFAPDSSYRWMASPAIDKKGNIGIGYSFGDTNSYVGQRFAARRPNDPPGQMSLKEVVLAAGEFHQQNTLRWQDYTATSIDPSDDCTIWYVGDFYRKNAPSYSTRISAVRLPGCK